MVSDGGGRVHHSQGDRVPAVEPAPRGVLRCKADTRCPRTGGDFGCCRQAGSRGRRKKKPALPGGSVLPRSPTAPPCPQQGRPEGLLASPPFLMISVSGSRVFTFVVGLSGRDWHKRLSDVESGGRTTNSRRGVRQKAHFLQLTPRVCSATIKMSWDGGGRIREEAAASDDGEQYRGCPSPGRRNTAPERQTIGAERYVVQMATAAFLP
jgi:hypothetical protein